MLRGLVALNLLLEMTKTSTAQSTQTFFYIESKHVLHVVDEAAYF